MMMLMMNIKSNHVIIHQKRRCEIIINKIEDKATQYIQESTVANVIKNIVIGVKC